MNDDHMLLLGQLKSDVKNLATSVDKLTEQMRALTFQIDGIRIWKAKIIGASIVASTVASATVSAVIVALETWAR